MGRAIGIAHEEGINDIKDKTIIFVFNAQYLSIAMVTEERKNPRPKKRLEAIRAKAIQSREAKANSQEESEKKEQPSCTRGA